MSKTVQVLLIVLLAGNLFVSLFNSKLVSASPGSVSVTTDEMSKSMQHILKEIVRYIEENGDNNVALHDETMLILESIRDDNEKNAKRITTISTDISNLKALYSANEKAKAETALYLFQELQNERAKRTAAENVDTFMTLLSFILGL